MIKRALFLLTVCGTVIGASLFTSPRAEEPVSFAKDIKPIFDNNCAACHSATTQLSKLDLSTRESAMRGGERGPDIVPGRADDSRLYRLVAGLEQPGMPLDGNALTAEQLATIRTWINEGAHWDAPPVETATNPPAGSPGAGPENAVLPPGARDYWAFKLPVQAPVPAGPASLKNPIDRFLEKARQEKGLKAAPRADRLTLLRRAHLDLIGLPPTPAETAAFLADTAPGAWERLIDKLLASPHYGERWGRHWLDVARYADSDGYEDDHDRPNAWRYRDYVIRALNEDKPYNVFLTEQLAGDEIDNKTVDTRIATAFLRLGPRVEVREGDNPQYRYDYLDDMIATIGKGTLGLTLQCARCHNHKFDPILQQDYALQATLFGYVETDFPLTPQEEVDAYDKKVAAISAKQAPLRAEIRKIEAPYRERLRAEAIKRDFPLNVQQAVAKPERTDRRRAAARRPGAQERDHRHQGRRGDDARGSGAAQGARRADRGDREGTPRAVADGRHRDRRRLPLLARSGDRRDGGGGQPRGAPGATQGKLPPHGSRPVRSAALVFPHSRRPERQRRPDEAGLRHGRDLRQPGHRDSAARRSHLGPPAGARPVADVAGQSAARPRHGQPDLGPPLRPRHRRHARRTSARWAISRRIRNCSTGWRWNS